MFEKSEESLGALETGGEIRNAGGRSLLVVVKPIATAVGLLGAMRITLDSAARAVAVGTADHTPGAALWLWAALDLVAVGSRKKNSPKFAAISCLHSLKSLCGGGVPSSHPSLGLSVFFLSFFLHAHAHVSCVTHGGSGSGTSRSVPHTSYRHTRTATHSHRV